jgi:enoyl-CoA hydratase
VLLFDETSGPSRLVAARPWIDDAFAADTVAEIIARLRARPEADAVATADTLAALAPTALTVTLAAVRAARRLPDLRARSRRVRPRAVVRPDAARSARGAQLVDKDRDPHWHPAALADLEDGLAERALAFEPPLALWAPR